MKRIALGVDESLLEEATRLSGEESPSATVNRALREFVKSVKAGRVLHLRNLAEAGADSLDDDGLSTLPGS